MLDPSMGGASAMDTLFRLFSTGTGILLLGGPVPVWPTLWYPYEGSRPKSIDEGRMGGMLGGVVYTDEEASPDVNVESRRLSVPAGGSPL